MLKGIHLYAPTANLFVTKIFENGVIIENFHQAKLHEVVLTAPDLRLVQVCSNASLQILQLAFGLARSRTDSHLTNEGFLPLDLGLAESHFSTYTSSP